MLKRLIFYTCVFSCFIFTSCKNYYNEMIHWADSIEKGTSIEIVKENQPFFIEINWKTPDTFDNKLLYRITDIKGSHDPLNMTHSLVFIDNKYQGRKATK